MSKRLFDLVATACMLPVALPLILIVGTVIFLSSPGKVFHRALRVGKDGNLFRLYKFRTMVPDADVVGPGITTQNDARITPAGRLLRRTKLDEIPQIFNVLRGEMSLVGPRPEDPRYVELYSDKQKEVLTVRPGITSLAAIRFRHEEYLLTGSDWETVYINNIMPEKLAIDLQYIRQSSILLDIRILLQTLLAVLTPRI